MPYRNCSFQLWQGPVSDVYKRQEAEYAKIAEGYKMEIDQVKKFIRQEDLVKDIVVEKAINLVRDNAVVTEAKEEKAAE